MLNDFLEEHTSGPNDAGGVAVLPKVQQEIRIGFAAEEITRASKEADLVIMGTTGEGNLLEKVFGSVSTYVASHAKCPVLLVPGNCLCLGFNNIVYASNNIEADKVMLEQVFSLVKTGPANVHFVHVDKEGLAGQGQEYIVRNAQFEAAVRKGLPTVGFNSVSISCEDVQKGIVQYASDIKADLVVTATTHRGFLERLFHKSVTREVVFHTTIPLMILHYDH
jgi:nucleotide-binding universal stress UspA family protein